MSMKRGRLAPHDPVTHPRLRLGTLLGGSYPPAPAVVDYVSGIADWPMYMNGPDPTNPPQIPDGIGDCTFAAPGHMIQAWTYFATDTAVEVTNADLLAGYEAVTGYVLGDPSTDQGANMQDVLGHWRKVGIGGHRILAFAEVNVRNAAEVEAALALFGHIYVGVNLPGNAERQFEAGAPWAVVDDAPGEDGHAICWGYAAKGHNHKVITWGRAQEVVPAWMTKYAEEMWVVVDQEWINANGANPEGVNAAALGEAFTAITGEPSPFPVQPTPQPPAPTPTPVPVDSPDPALAAAFRADGWVTRRHTGDNAHVASAARSWLDIKGI